MMTPEQESRFQILSQSACSPGQYFQDYYGLKAWPPAAGTEAAAAFDRYRAGLRRTTACPAQTWSRYELEGFMARFDVLPRKWAGARLGMNEDSIQLVLEALGQLGLRRDRYELDTTFILEKLLHDDLIRSLPGMRFRTFGDHNGFCERLHAEFRKLGVAVTPLFCATQDRLGEYPRRYAMYFDALTLEPLSAGHSVWLDFRKPLNLPPDRCSKLFYVENRDVLRPYVAGTGEPDGLVQYEQFLAGAPHA